MIDTYKNIDELETGNFIYYINEFENLFSKIKANRSWLNFDDNEVIKFSRNYFTKKFKTNKKSIDSEFFHPCTIAQAGIGFYDIYIKTKNSEAKRKFWAQIKWFEKNYVEYKNTYVYPFPFTVKNFGIKPNWISGMYQGEILSCFVRAYVLSGDSKYLNFSEKVYKSFFLKLGDKFGNRVTDKYGLWYEEAMLNPPTHILNGFIYAMWGILDYYKITKKEDVLNEWESCIHTLVNALPKYDMGFWSYYDLNKTIASYYYHENVHIPQLKVLYELTGLEIFKYYYTKWELYSNRWIYRLFKKIYSTYQKLWKK